MAKKFAVVLGVIFVLMGILGFISNPLIGAMGLFMTNSLLNVVYLVIGVVLLIVAFSAPAASALWLKIFGVIVLILTVLGFLMIAGGGSLFGLLTMNSADHWLHLVLGIILLIGGMRKDAAAPVPMPTV